MIEYRLRWNTRKQGKKNLFEEPELLGDSKLFGADITEMELYCSKDSDNVSKGVWITTSKGGFLLEN